MDQNVTQDNEEAIPENNQNDQNNMASLLEKEGLGIDFPTQGEIRKGVVAASLQDRYLSASAPSPKG